MLVDFTGRRKMPTTLVFSSSKLAKTSPASGKRDLRRKFWFYYPHPQTTNDKDQYFLLICTLEPARHLTFKKLTEALSKAIDPYNSITETNDKIFLMRM
jgi:hypothetical protein